MGTLPLLLCLCVPCQTSPLLAKPVLNPWPDAAAEGRQAFVITASVARSQPVVTISPRAPRDVPVRLVMASDYAHPLAVYRDKLDRLHVRLPVGVGPDKPAIVYAYWSTARGWDASPNLDALPLGADDYATTAHGAAWDFNHGTQCGITDWGNHSSDYGHVEVRDGHLVIPITGDDPWFTWGVMWGSSKDPRAEHISSKIYDRLSLRLRQTCKDAKWCFYFTDMQGRYQEYDFQVHGTDWQVFSFDLRKALPGFWDGREMRALRIDPPKKSPGTTAEIDWVRIERAPAEVAYGPVMTAEEVDARGHVKTVAADLPTDVVAGRRVAIQAAGLDGERKPVAEVPLFLGQQEAEKSTFGRTLAADTDGVVSADLPAGTRAGRRQWLVALADDLGRPMAPQVTKPLAVHPAALDHFELSAPSPMVYVDKPVAKITVWGADAFGNHIAVDLGHPQWTVTGGAKVAQGPVTGAPAVVQVRCPTKPAVRQTLTLADASGHTGSLELMTMALKTHPVKLDPNGYMVLDDGTLYLPLGGFYANWPNSPPDAEGRIGRALDLFPCGPVPYKCGYPWSARVEKQVTDFLELCHSNGVTGLRLMLRNVDLVGRADPVQVKAVLHLFDLARPLGIKFDVALFDDYDKPPYCNAQVLKSVVLPHYTTAALRHLPAYRQRFLVDKRLLPNAAAKYTDPDAIACQEDYLRDLIPHLADRNEIFCYELENEMVFPPMSWVNKMADLLHSLDPRTLVLADPGPHDWPEPRRWAGSKIDLFSYHPYNDGEPDADHGAVVFVCSKWAAASGKPFFTGEGGINQNRWQAGVKKAAAAYVGRGIRDQIWMSLCCGAKGCFIWTPENDSELREFGSVGPALKALGLDLRSMHRRRPALALALPDNGDANGKTYALAWKLLGAGVDFDTVPAAEAAKYSHALKVADLDPATLQQAVAALTSEVGRPSQGYQMCYLADQQNRHVLIYLRNVAGGIVNLGGARALYLRDPKPARAEVRLSKPGDDWTAHAYDLDDRKPVHVSVDPQGNILVAASSSHDFVLSLSR